MENVLTFGSLRGGTGKTTFALNLSFFLAQNKKLLFIDFDTAAQTLKTLFTENYEKHRTINHFLISKLKGMTPLSTSEITFNVKLNNIKIDFIISSDDPKMAYSTFIGDVQHKKTMKSKFFELVNELSKEYDYIIIDTSPGMDDSILFSLDCTKYFYYILRDRTIEYFNYINQFEPIWKNKENLSKNILVNNTFRTENEIMETLKDLEIFSDFINDILIVPFDQKLLKNNYPNKRNSQVDPLNEVNILKEDSSKSSVLREALQKIFSDLS